MEYKRTLVVSKTKKINQTVIGEGYPAILNEELINAFLGNLEEYLRKNCGPIKGTIESDCIRYYKYTDNEYELLVKVNNASKSQKA